VLRSTTSEPDCLQKLQTVGIVTGQETIEGVNPSLTNLRYAVTG
jgi:hypothetical protein